MDRKVQRNSDNAHRTISVLIVEDEPSAREAMRLYLLATGYQVATAASLQGALHQSEALAPDVLVCDWQLAEGASGVDVARELQQKYAVAIIFATAHPVDELQRAAQGLKVERFMRKPISLKVLAETIDGIDGSAH